MNSRKLVWSMVFVLLLGTVAAAQVPSHTAIESGNKGSVLAPTDPNGFLNIGPYVWISDTKGILSYLTDPSNPSPLETGIYGFNLNSNWSIDNLACLPFCSTGQVVKVNDTLAFAAVWDHSQGGRLGGLWMIQFLSPLPDPDTSMFPFTGDIQLASNKGLGGNQPTSLAIGPDGAAYFGNLKNNNLLRLPQPTNTDPNQNVISVGVIPSGKPIYALVFNGSQLYAGVGDGFYVFGANSDITQCSGNANNCGTSKLLMGRTSVNGVAADGLGHVYFVAANGGFLYRYNVSAGTVTRADSGLIIEAGHTSTLAFDKDGNLWLGEQPAGADIPNGGRVRVYLAADLARLP
jgi:ligand-binding sensor domain-containing protein